MTITPGIEDIRLAFTDFVNKVPFYGAVILCMEDPNIQKIFPGIRRRTITYGRTAQVDLEIGEVELQAKGSEFRIDRNGSPLGQFHLNVPGIHNVLNATAALAVGLEMELKPEQIREGLAQFSGVDRRFTVRGVERGITVVDDYGHHPTEIKATLAAARLSPFNKIRVLFQPHRFTRTKHLLDDFGTAFHQADDVYLLDIYAASEEEIAGVSGAVLAEKLRSYGHRSVHFVPTLNEGIEAIAAAAEPGDLVITLGAGSVSQAADRILERFKEQRMARRPDATWPAVRRATRQAEKPSLFDNFRWSRILLWGVLGMTVLAGTLFGWHRTEEFLIRDDRFRLSEPQDYAG